MKPLYWIFIFFCQSAFAQLYWSDSFQNVNNLTNGVWKGDTADFVITMDQKLQLNATGSGSSRLYRESSIGYKSSWMFFISMDFNPSSSNNARIILAKNDDENFFVAFGEGGRDQIEVGLTANNQDSLWAASPQDFLDSANVEGVFQLFQDSTGDYSAFWSSSNGGSTHLFSTQGPKAIKSDFFEITCQYTSTRADKFFFDDISVHGSPFIDLSKPYVESIQVEKELIKLTFSKPVANNKMVYWTDSSTAALVQNQFSKTHYIHTPKSINLCILDLASWKDSTAQEVDSLLTYQNHETLDNNLFISEIMHDATPSRGLPENEFIELYCAKDLFWNKGFLVINRDTTELPRYHFKTGRAYILSSKAGETINSITSINLQDFTIPRDQAVINIYDEGGTLLAYQEYNKNSHNDMGLQGGFSLERSNFSIPICPPYLINTTTSSSGGSPGSINIFDPAVNNTNGQTLKYLEGQNLFFRTSHYLKPGRVKAHLKNHAPPFPIQFNPENRREFFIKMPPFSDTLILLQPLVSQTNDTLPRKWYIEIPHENGRLEISEIMYDCDEDGEFIEIANPESHSVFLQKTWIGKWENQLFYQEYKPFVKNWIIPANGQIALVESEGFYKKQKGSIGSIIEILNWKNLVNSGGEIGVFLSETSRPFKYNDDVHYSWLENTKNVSLGREQTDRGKVTSQKKVTLGLKNATSTDSQVENNISTDKNVIQAHLSPMKIKINATQSCKATLRLISLSGECYYTFFENHFMQSTEEITFYGTNSSGGKLNPGPYLLKLTLYTLDGKIKNELKKIAIAP